MQKRLKLNGEKVTTGVAYFFLLLLAKGNK